MESFSQIFTLIQIVVYYFRFLLENRSGGMVFVYSGAVAGASDCNIHEMGTVGRCWAVVCHMGSCELILIIQKPC